MSAKAAAKENANQLDEVAVRKGRKPTRGSGDAMDWYIAGAFLLLGAAGLRAVSDPVLWNELNQRQSAVTQSMGTVMRKHGGVRYRTYGSPMWHDLTEASHAVSAGDTVFTGDDGRAELRLTDGSVADVQPGSLVVVGRAPESMRAQGGWLAGALNKMVGRATDASLLKVEKGTARLSLRKDSAPLRVQIRDKIYSLSNSGANGDAAETSADVTVPSGGQSARFTSAGVGGKIEIAEGATAVGRRVVEFGAGQAAELGQGDSELRLRVDRVQPTEPAIGAQMIGDAASVTPFAWRWQGDRSETVKLDIAEALPSGEAGPLSHSRSVPGNQKGVSLQLAPGQYRWRLTAGEGAQKVETSWRAFRKVELAPPARLGPMEGTVFASSTREPVRVAFSWRPMPAPLKVEVEWGLDPTTVTKATAEQSSPLAAQVHQVRLPHGKYVWRVRSVTDDGRTSAWSEPQKFSVLGAAEPLASAPSVLLAPASDAPPIVAPPVAAAPAPAAVVVPPPPAVVAKVAPPKSKVKAKSKGKAKAVEVEKPEAPAPIVYEAPVPKLSVGSAGGSTQLGNTERLDQLPIPLSWGELEGAKGYEVSVVSSATGKVLHKKNVTEPRLEWVLRSLAETKFAYQVIAVMKDGKKFSSEAVPIEVRLSAPPLKMPTSGSKIELTRSGSLLLTWERTVLTDFYEIEVAEDVKFTKGVRKETAPRNLLSMRAVKPGKYFWRVRSVASKNTGPWAKPAHFTVKPSQ
jgi:hypothetical protein